VGLKPRRERIVTRFDLEIVMPEAVPGPNHSITTLQSVHEQSSGLLPLDLERDSAHAERNVNYRN
jgi:hypothetical protein